MPRTPGSGPKRNGHITLEGLVVVPAAVADGGDAALAAVGGGDAGGGNSKFSDCPNRTRIPVTDPESLEDRNLQIWNWFPDSRLRLPAVFVGDQEQILEQHVGQRGLDAAAVAGGVAEVGSGLLAGGVDNVPSDDWRDQASKPPPA